ncbi:histone-lysine N-methyltransferase family member SUVH9-like [Cynara cardunculus var. scolymus]|uniref:histone-lysine N-methyltransferase family member SUVH9-like n=1 Tax=Cynara cardunculus var. scolymus TaxID=59895 RepID=UPI000D625F40|nr:histone-lysine N-methyltransferase family member SUVH9-like [Cynara cardunculus var. scolymus]XP_024983720.1 histone-lysine N-methyltransferase family member SUVH9-like [Cynara cardunculus var. scolymus]
MGSAIDLFLYPDHSTATITTVSGSAGGGIGGPSTATTLKTPKVEPKLEPLDEPLGVSPEPDNSRNPNPHFSPSAPLTDSNFTVAPPGFVENNVHSGFNAELASNIEENDELQVIYPDALAIVPVPEEDQLSTVECSSRRKSQQRSAELVRVMNLQIEDERYFRDLVRKTRMLYDSLWVYTMVEDEKRRSYTNGRMPRTRGDLKAATMMKDSGLWLNREKRIVGAIPGIHVGDVFFFRMELCVLGIHGQAQAGIDFLSSSHSSNGEPIATSVIVSGGYEDDEDGGDVIVYTGHGGQDKHGKQVVHQKLDGGNLGMERSKHHGIEVRVVRGFKYKGSASEKVYVYDGLYKIVDAWFEVGKSGFGVYKFKLVRMEGQPELGSAILKFAENIRTSPLEARPSGYVSLDISSNKENVPVFLFNDIDSNYEPLSYEYLVKTIFPPFVYHLGGIDGGCDCVSGCSSDCVCAKKNGGEFAYDMNGLLLRGKPLIFECGPHCSCPPRCCNRISQKGLRNRFEVFRSMETGWGVRSLDLIQAGSFICEYTGVVLTREQAQVFTMNGDSLVYPNRFGERWAEWGDLSQVFPHYVRPSYPSVPPLNFAMDVSRMRNVACYMSHSSCPNVFVQLVLFDHSNVAFPHLMLFAMEDIPPMRELSLDYGAADEWTEKLAICN